MSESTHPLHVASLAPFPVGQLTKEELRTLKTISRKKKETSVVSIARLQFDRKPIPRYLLQTVISEMQGIDPKYGSKTRACVILSSIAHSDLELSDLASKEISAMLVYCGAQSTATGLRGAMRALIRAMTSNRSTLPMLRRYPEHSSLYRACVSTLKRLKSGYGAGAMAEVLLVPGGLVTKRLKVMAFSSIFELLDSAALIETGNLPEEHIRSIASVLTKSSDIGRTHAAALKVLKLHGGLESIEIVEALNASRLNAETRTAIDDALPHIRVRAQHQHNAKILLRPSHADESQSLLRPASSPGDSAGANLLLPAEIDPPTPTE